MTASAPRVQPGSFLTLHYRLAGPAGEIINTFAGKPATLTLGAGELSPAVEQRLLGLEEGARRSFDIPRGEAAGTIRGHHGQVTPCRLRQQVQAARLALHGQGVDAALRQGAPRIELAAALQDGGEHQPLDLLFRVHARMDLPERPLGLLRGARLPPHIRIPS